MDKWKKSKKYNKNKKLNKNISEKPASIRIPTFRRRARHCPLISIEIINTNTKKSKKKIKYNNNNYYKNCIWPIRANNNNAGGNIGNANKLLITNRSMGFPGNEMKKKKNGGKD